MNAAILDGLRSDKLGLIILPTEDCNFRCTYCYEDFDQGKMSPETVRRLKLFLGSHASSTKHLNVEWFGGEPLAAYDIVVDILSFIKNNFQESDFNCSMTTNGSLLTVKRAIELEQLGVKTYQISLDGYGEVHDRTRKRRNGGGTFRQIWKSLKKLRNSDVEFEIKLRIHYSPSSIHYTPELISNINSEFGSDPRFSLFLKAIGKYGGADDDKIETFSQPFQTKIESNIIASTKMQGSGGSRESALENFPVCYASKANNYVIRANGDISKCTVDLKRDTNIIGSLQPDGTITQDAKKLEFWMRGVFSNDEDHLLCPAHAAT